VGAGSLFGLVITGLFVGIDKLDDIFEDIIDCIVNAINDSTLDGVFMVFTISISMV